MGAVSGPECIVDVSVAKACEGSGELRVVAFFAGMEAQVLEKQNVPWAERLGLRGDLVTNTVRRHRDGTTKQLRQPCRDGLETHLRIGLTLGPSQM